MESNKKLFIYQIVLLAAIFAIGALSYEYIHLAENYSTRYPKNISLKKDLPRYEEIMAVLRPLEYSGFPELTSPKVDLTIDFDKRTWTLHNIHDYDPQGNIILDGGRYGLCAELAVYTYTKIKPLLGDQYYIQFARVAESGFFFAPKATHIILLLKDRSTNVAYLIDPSFHRYERDDNFDDYLFYETADTIPFLKDRSPDQDFPVDGGSPLLIRKNFLLNFSVRSVDGKFDKDNFMLSVTANKRYKFADRYVFVMQKRSGKVGIFKNQWLLDKTMKPEEIKLLYNKLMLWFKSI